MGVVSRFAWFVVVAMALTLVVACSPEEDDEVRIRHLAPTPAQQSKALSIYGHGFGDYVMGSSGVMLGSTCADVLEWGDEAVVVQVPTGIGLGVRVVTVVSARGGRASAELEVAGHDLPPSDRSACAFSPNIVLDVLPDTSVDTGADTSVDTGIDTGVDTGWVDVPPDTVPPQDVPPDEVTLWDTSDNEWWENDTSDNEWWDYDTADDDWWEYDTSDDDWWEYDTRSDTDPWTDVWPDECWIAISDGACTQDPAECETIQYETEWILDTTTTCTLDCLSTSSEEQCTRRCVRQNTGLGGQCSGCFATLSTCTIDNCLAECVVDMESWECKDCQSVYCHYDFELCSGLTAEILW